MTSTAAAFAVSEGFFYPYIPEDEEQEASIWLSDDAWSRFRRRTVQEGTHLLWTGRTTREGSPSFYIGQLGAKQIFRSCRALAWEMRYGPGTALGRTLKVECGNPRCLSHLAVLVSRHDD